MLINSLGLLKTGSLIHEVTVAGSALGQFTLPPTQFHALPLRTTVGFGSTSDIREIDSTVLGRYGVSQIAAQDTVLSSAVNIQNHAVCGPMVARNTLGCYSAQSGSLLSSYAIPGNLSTTPLYLSGSWVFGTSEGFLIRTQGLSLKSVPISGFENNVFWGPESKKVAQYLKPPTRLDGPETENSPKKKFRTQARSGWQWFQSYSFEFTGTPVSLSNSLYAQSTDGYVHSFDFESGKLNWSTRVGSDGALKLASSSLAASSKEIIVGSQDGSLVLLNPKDGSQLARTAPNYLAGSEASPERFAGIVAQPTLLGRSVLFSTAEGFTQKMNLDSRAVEWTYPLGSVAKVETIDGSAVIGGQDGSVAKLDHRNGMLNWKVKVYSDSVVASVVTTKQSASGQRGVLVASKNGRITLLDFKSGRVLEEIAFPGEVVSEFFTLAGNETAQKFVSNKATNNLIQEGLEARSRSCLSYSNQTFRCFAVTLN
jgi:outer membrane protein assembly factor BamB